MRSFWPAVPKAWQHEAGSRRLSTLSTGNLGAFNSRTDWWGVHAKGVGTLTDRDAELLESVPLWYAELLLVLVALRCKEGRCHAAE